MAEFSSQCKQALRITMNCWMHITRPMLSDNI